MSKNDSLGDRMKGYEACSKTRLTPRMPVIIRIDGRSFHNYCRGMEKPFDATFREDMAQLALFLCEEVSTCVFGYGQSDEISLLLHPYKRLESQPFFDNEVQKICSIVAGIASSWLTLRSHDRVVKTKKMPTFDARVFTIPESEVVNYFIFRQQDATRNSIQMAGQSYFSHKQLHGKSCPEIQEMLFQEHKINWSRHYSIPYKRGIAVRKAPVEIDTKNGPVTRMKFQIDYKMPELTKDRSYINDLLATEKS